MILKISSILLLLILVCSGSCTPSMETSRILTGAEQTDAYLPILHGKRIALVANHTSLLNNQHLADTLLSLKVNLIKIFSPEHGFRGKMDAGQLVPNSKDTVTGLPVVSLYGNHKKPLPADLEGVDLIVYDIQDVGVRFYTYHSTLHYVMEAAAESGVPLLLLDRPNPNGNYIDGPVLDTAFRSFVGMHPVPVVHGMTSGEYAAMINGEGWLNNKIECDLTVIPCKNYKHSDIWIPMVPPSPNLPNIQAIRLYPSLCLFEGTVVSLGRGTDFPFQVYGHPLLGKGFCFTPESRPGASVEPPLKGQLCCGEDLRDYRPQSGEFDRIELKWVIKAYQEIGSTGFFNSYFNKLAGNSLLRTQIEQGFSVEEIRAEWQEDLRAFSILREKYLLYP